MAKKRNPRMNRNRQQLDVQRQIDQDEATATARTSIRPNVQAAATLQAYGKEFGDLDLMGLVDSLSEQTHASRKGDFKRGEAMLTAQAHTLDAIFNVLARRAANNFGCYPETVDRYLKLALRAQSQCRATWETLSTIKNPPMVGYVRQANIAHGPQQVNNVSAGRDGAQSTADDPILQNKLLEEEHGERLDTGATCAPSRVDSAMETLGEVDRAKDRGR